MDGADPENCVERKKRPRRNARAARVEGIDWGGMKEKWGNSGTATVKSAKREEKGKEKAR